jgi:hypothetical protein
MSEQITGISRLIKAAEDFGVPREQISDLCGHVHNASRRLKSRFKAVTSEEWLFKDVAYKVAAQVWLLGEYSERGFQTRGHCLIKELERQKAFMDTDGARRLEGILTGARQSLDIKERERRQRAEHLDGLSREELYGAPSSEPHCSD